MGSSHTSYGLHAQDIPGRPISPHCSEELSVCACRLLGMARTLGSDAAAGDAGEAGADKLVTAVSKPDHSVGFTDHSVGKGFSLP